MRLLSLSGLAASLIAPWVVCGAHAQPIASPPATRTVAASDVYHGVTVADPYRWLEDSSDPAVKAWSDAQNAHARAELDAIAQRAPIKAQLTRLITASSPSFSGLSANGAFVFATYNDPARQQPTLVVMNATADPASRRTVLDPNVLDPSGHTEIDWWVASADGSKVAVSLSRNGSEDGVLHVYSVADGQEVGEPIPRVQFPTAGGALAWAPDGQGFWYTRYPGEEAPEADRHFNLQVYFHRLGADWRADTLALGHADGLERVSEIFLDNRADRPAVVALVQRGDGGEYATYLLRRDQSAMPLSDYPDRIVAAVMGPDGAVYGVSHAGAPNGKIVKLVGPFSAEGLSHAPTIVPESSGAIRTDGAEQGIASLVLTRDRLFIRDLVGGPSDVRVFDHDGHPQGQLPLPPVADVEEIAPLADGSVLYDVQTYLRPRYYDSWNPATGQAHETALAQTSPIRFDDAEVRRVFATSKDGTRVPLNVIMKKGMALDGRSPALLYGYGGYGISETPHFAGSSVRTWLDGGGAYVFANIRGGAEYGERWHEQGARLNKQNVFDDFDAAGRYLVSARYTSHARLALLGASNGGLLMGAMITQHPALAHAVVSAVGIYDMLRVELDPNGAFNTTEFGTVKDPAQFRALYAFSPYHHVVAGTAYPAVLLTTGANDGRVNPMQSRKFAAALQAATSSGLPVLLRTSQTSGHGIGSSLADRIDLNADMLAFLFEQLGMTLEPEP
jgi:prolyl oligopeptidase